MLKAIRWVTWDKVSNKGEFTFPYGGMDCFKCTCQPRTAQKVQNKIKLSEGLEGYQGSEELWDQDPGEKESPEK